jgi:hypothetical protein
MRTLALLLVCACFHAEVLSAQMPDGYVSVGIDALPNAGGAPVEVRARLFADEKVTPFQHLTLRAAGSLDVLAGRTADGSSAGATDARFVPADIYAEVTGDRGDLRVGYSRVVWGRLDEVQPTDVVNPLDLARFFFEGRSEARLAVPMARGRFFFGERANVEAVLVPWFRRGSFDLLDESSSPFNLQAGGVPPVRRAPAASWRNLQGGGRVSVTMGRVDWAVSAYRGFDAFGAFIPAGLAPGGLQPAAVAQIFPRYTMVGADFETTKGQSAFRGEIARLSGGIESIDGGLGFDRRAGDYHVSGTVLVHHEPGPDCSAQSFTCTALGPAGAYTSASLVAAADRTFARERYRTRTFAVYNGTERATFLRNITAMEVRANVTLEGSIGWYFGTGGAGGRRDLIGRFSDRDFLYARLRVHF